MLEKADFKLKEAVKVYHLGVMKRARYVLTNVNLYVEAIDAQGRVRTLTSKSLWLQYSGRQKVTLSWTGALYNEWLRIRLTSDNSVTIYLMRLNATPAVLVLARENVTASQYTMYMERWTARRGLPRAGLSSGSRARLQHFRCRAGALVREVNRALARASPYSVGVGHLSARPRSFRRLRPLQHLRYK
jgi:hypothetical protein